MVSGSKHDIVKNPRHPLRHCKLCNGNYIITCCTKRTTLKTGATEYAVNDAMNCGTVAHYDSSDEDNIPLNKLAI